MNINIETIEKIMDYNQVPANLQGKVLRDLRLYEAGKQSVKPDSPVKRNSSELLGLGPRQMLERFNTP